jgi:predicted nucleotidyltransferase component of viral defense system
LVTVYQEQYLLKGGYALELRLPHRARATLDLDFATDTGSVENILDHLQAAATHDLNDYFRYRVSLPGRNDLVGPPEGGYRFTVDSYIEGNRLFASFAIDVGMGDIRVEPTDLLDTMVSLEFAEIALVQIPTIPLAQHFAEKLHAYTRPRTHQTRVKDLVDLMLMIGELGLQPDGRTKQVLEETFNSYATHARPNSDTLSLPPESWRNGFRRQMIDLQTEPTELEAAHQILLGFLQRLDTLQ